MEKDFYLAVKRSLDLGDARLSAEMGSDPNEETYMCFLKACEVNKNYNVHITFPMWQPTSQLVIRYLTVKEKEDIVYRTPPGIDINLQINDPPWRDPVGEFYLHLFTITPLRILTFVILELHCALISGKEAEIEFGWVTK